VNKGLFDLVPTIQAYIRFLRASKNGEGGDLEKRLLQAQTQEREAKAALCRIALDQRRGELIPLEEIKRQWTARLIEFKAAMLEMPKQAAFRFVDADIRMHVEEELNSFAIETLARYSRGGIRAMGGGDDAAGAKAAAVDNGQPVGRRKPNPKRKSEPAAGAVEDKPNPVST
jgi:hypothetical protein